MFVNYAKIRQRKYIYFGDITDFETLVVIRSELSKSSSGMDSDTFEAS